MRVARTKPKRAALVGAPDGMWLRVKLRDAFNRKAARAPYKESQMGVQGGALVDSKQDAARAITNN